MDGTMTLQLIVNNQPCVKTVEVDFLIITNYNNVYNAILGRPSLIKIKAIVSSPHLLMKFPTSQGVGQVRVDQQVVRRCYMASMPNYDAIEKMVEQTGQATSCCKHTK